MATYTVIQDIEAEDKFLGPLTLKQFIFGAAGIFFGYLGFFAVTQGAAFLLIIFAPPALLGLFLAIPWSKEQPTELWVIAKLRFRIKSRIRLWDQSGLEELVTITVPKKIEKQLTDGLKQYEVESRLKALAETIDTRGWATKNATLTQAYGSPGQMTNDRLMNLASIQPVEVPDIDINSFNDIMDDGNRVSSSFTQMIQSSTQQHRQATLDRMEQIRRGQPLQTQQPAIQFTPPAAPMQTADENLLSQQLQAQRAQNSMVNDRMRTVPVKPVQRAAPAPVPDPVAYVEDYVPEQPLAPMTPAVNPDILDLAHNNDLDIATIARQAKKKDDGEVVVSLR